MRILVDFHHTALLRSMVMLFEDRLGHEVYRPIGMPWFTEGFWNVYPSIDTARQFLDPSSQPIDGTPMLNSVIEGDLQTCLVKDPGGETSHRAVMLGAFKEMKFDLVIASIPAHVPLFRELIRRFAPQAKLIFAVGNEGWPTDGMNVLSSLIPGSHPHARTVVHHHQEFDLDMFRSTEAEWTGSIGCYVNVLHEQGRAQSDFTNVENDLRGLAMMWSFGGACRDGCLEGPRAVGDSMRSMTAVFHVKPQGDGYGHVIHNAFAVGRPVITRTSHYQGKLAGRLMVPGVIVDLDRVGYQGVMEAVRSWRKHPDDLVVAGMMAAEQFKKEVDFAQDALEVQAWLDRLE